MPNLSELARELRETLLDNPKAIKVEVAGSIRRGRPDPHDMEICALVAPEPSLFPSALEYPCNAPRHYLRDRATKVVKNGAKYSQYVIDGATLDYFQTADPLQWGMLFFIRTGSAAYVKSALTEWKRLNDWKGYCKGNVLYRAAEQPEPTPRESDVFDALQRQYCEPERRT